MTLTRVLFVDDEPHVLAGLRRLLRNQRHQWDMHFAEGGVAGLELCQQQPFDVVVSDMRMPGMDGAEFLSVVATKFPSTVRLVLSGQSEQEKILRAVGPAHQFLSKPCTPEQLITAIQATSSLQQRLHHPALQQLVSRLDALPMLPEIYQRILEELNRADPSVERVGKLIGRDLALTAMVLKLVSSSFFGLPTRVTTAEHAASLLGLNVLRPLILSAHLFGHYQSRLPKHFSLDQMIDHSLKVGRAAQAIAQQQRAPQLLVDNSFLAGTLHDVGRLILASSLPDEYQEVIAESSRGEAPLHQLEHARFGSSHAEIGGYLLGLWGLPTEIVEAVTYHHQPHEATPHKFNAITAVSVAAAMMHEGPQAANANLPHDYLAALGLTAHLPAWKSLCEKVTS